MKRRLLLRVYIVAVVLAFLAIAVSVVWRAGTTRAFQYQQAAESFRELSRETAGLWQTVPLDKAAQTLARRIVVPGKPRPVMVGVSAFDTGFDYLWATDNRFVPAGFDPKYAEGFPEHVGTWNHARFVRTFEVPHGEHRMMTALYPLLPRSSLYEILRDALYAALVVLVVTILVALVALLKGRTAAEAGPLPERGPAPEPIIPQNQPSARRATPATPATPDAGGSAKIQPEERLRERLDAELERAGFSEQDLSVAIIEFTGDARDEAIYREQCEAVRSFFVFKDLCFETEGNALVVLIPNSTLSEALGLMERFQRHFWEQRVLWNREQADFHAGVSARAARLVDADRILGECRAALRQSRNTPGRIVGFQPDPQKYREFLTHRPA